MAGLDSTSLVLFCTSVHLKVHASPVPLLKFSYPRIRSLKRSGVLFLRIVGEAWNLLMLQASHTSLD